MIIGINGFKGSGKDLVADIIVHNAAIKSAGTYSEGAKMSFADKLKKVCVSLFDLDEKIIKGYTEPGYTGPDPKDAPTWIAFSDFNGMEIKVRDALHAFDTSREYLSHREILQLMGTDILRGWMPNIWINLLFKQIEKDKDKRLESKSKCLYVISDARFTNECQEIRNIGGYIIQVNRPGKASGGHSSEQGIDTSLVDYVINNDGDLQDLELKTIEALNFLLDKV